MGMRFFVLIQCCTVFLRLDDSIHWKWKEIFWTYWVLFSVMIGINFGIFLILTSKICQKIFGEVDTFEGMLLKYISFIKF